jgi:flagellar basal-body rod protein FlgB
MFKDRLPLYDSAMDAYAARQKVIAENIANATTPGFKPGKVKFEELFSGEKATLAGARTDEGHIPIGAASARQVEGEVVQQEIPKAEEYFSGESHVNIDKEMSDLAQNQLRFRMASRVAKSYFDGLNSSIKGLPQ